MDSYRAWADIDLDALEHNLEVIRDRAGDRVRLLLVVKADAYGHGAVAIAHHAVRCGVSALGVGTSAEALELRRAGICIPLLVLGTVVDEEVVAVLSHDIQIGVHSTSRVVMLEEVARKLDCTARVHLNVDTGMGRLGVLPAKAPEILQRIKQSEHLELAGIMTHFASLGKSGAEGAGEDDRQVQRFESVLAQAREHDLLGGWIHAANSSAVFRGTSPLYDAVRIGIAAYGILPGESDQAQTLKPVLSLRSQVIFLKDIPKGSTVGYDSTWVAPRDSRIGTLPMGYNDGVVWSLSNRGQVLIRGHRAPIVGRVSMDYTTVDLTDIPGVDVGDKVTLIGRDGDEEIRIEDISRWAGTIPYEITCAVGKRVERVFHATSIKYLPRPARTPAPAPREPVAGVPGSVT